MTDPSKTDIPDDIQWKRMSFKGNKVWAPFHSQGKPAAQNGRIKIKYNLNQAYEYQIKLSHLKPEDQAVPARQRRKKEKKNPAQPLPPNCIRIYTAGTAAGPPAPSGIGILMRYKENRKDISESIGSATSNTAELKAIHRALIALKRRDLPVRIFTASAYSAEQLTKKGRPAANKELIVAIRSLMARFTDIQIIQIKGRAGIKDNEVANFLAASAIDI